MKTLKELSITIYCRCNSIGLECQTFNLKVVGSSPTSGSNNYIVI